MCEKGCEKGCVIRGVSGCISGFGRVLGVFDSSVKGT